MSLLDAAERLVALGKKLPEGSTLSELCWRMALCAHEGAMHETIKAGEKELARLAKSETTTAAEPAAESE